MHLGECQYYGDDAQKRLNGQLNAAGNEVGLSGQLTLSSLHQIDDGDDERNDGYYDQKNGADEQQLPGFLLEANAEYVKDACEDDEDAQ